MKTALIIIDIQNDYFPNGKSELYQANEALRATQKVLAYFRENHMPVYFIQHISSRDSSFFVPDTVGCQIHDDITPLSTEKVIVKHAPSSFYQTELESELQGESITNLVICGMMTHMCVDTTVRAARDLGYKNILISDACATKDLWWNGEKIAASFVQKSFLSALSGAFAETKTSDEYLSDVNQ